VNRHERTAGLRRFIEEIKAKQRNTVWPGPLLNGRSVDAFVWKGSPVASLVQRIGLWLIGSFYFAVGVLLLSLARRGQSLVLAIISVGAISIGLRVFFNGFQGWYRNKPKLQ
jgi:hypothetical protein